MVVANLHAAIGALLAGAVGAMLAAGLLRLAGLGRPAAGVASVNGATSGEPAGDETVDLSADDAEVEEAMAVAEAAEEEE